MKTTRLSWGRNISYLLTPIDFSVSHFTWTYCFKSEIQLSMLSKTLMQYAFDMVEFTLRFRPYEHSYNFFLFVSFAFSFIYLFSFLERVPTYANLKRLFESKNKMQVYKLNCL